jgi:hypothetical protein
MTSWWPARRSRAPRTSWGRPGRTAAPTPPASAQHGSTATSTSPADPAPARLATWRPTRPARLLSGWRASTWSWRARRPGSPIRRRWSGWPACTARGVARRGGGRRVHRAVQRPERRTAAVAPVPLHLPHSVRGRHRGTVRRDSLALRTLTGAASGQQRQPLAHQRPRHGRQVHHPQFEVEDSRGSILTVTAGCGRFPGSCRVVAGARTAVAGTHQQGRPLRQ